MGGTYRYRKSINYTVNTNANISHREDQIVFETHDVFHGKKLNYIQFMADTIRTECRKSKLKQCKKAIDDTFWFSFQCTADCYSN